MTKADQKTLARLMGGARGTQATTDDLQGLLLQVVFALLMVFMIAYFIFVEQQKKVRTEEVMALNRQKLTLALDKVAEDRRVRYGLNALMIQGVDGRRVFDPDTLVVDYGLRLAPAAKTAFAEGGKAARTDYAEKTATIEVWRQDVFAEAEIDPATLTAEEGEWFEKALADQVEAVRLDVRGVQRALAVRVQRHWAEEKALFKDVKDPRTIADLIREKSLKFVADELGGEVLP